LAYFGRIASHKGLDLLIESLVRERLTERLHLDIWGDGDTPRYFDIALRLGARDSIRFCGPFPEDRKGAELIASYDGIALTSRGSEGLPLILLEAMSYGLPFIASSVAAIPDCCADNPDAVLVEPTLEGVGAGLLEFAEHQ
jgi:glycosyltransferase involved in cell wall biosynthesis